MWNRVNRGWRPLLVAYVLVMAFTLVYTAEHYVIDILLGWALAAGVMLTMHGSNASKTFAGGGGNSADRGGAFVM